jgi:hypothetical protein
MTAAPSRSSYWPLLSDQRKAINPVRPSINADTLELDQMQNAYRAAVDEWITAIKQEEALVSVTLERTRDRRPFTAEARVRVP